MPPPATDDDIAAMLREKRAPECGPDELRAFRVTVNLLRTIRAARQRQAEAMTGRRTHRERAAKAIAELKRVLPTLIMVQAELSLSLPGEKERLNAKAKHDQFRQCLAALPDISSPPSPPSPRKATLEDITEVVAVYRTVFGSSQVSADSQAERVVAATLKLAGFVEMLPGTIAQSLLRARKPKRKKTPTNS